MRLTKLSKNIVIVIVVCVILAIITLLYFYFMSFKEGLTTKQKQEKMKKMKNAKIKGAPEIFTEWYILHAISGNLKKFSNTTLYYTPWNKLKWLLGGKIKYYKTKNVFKIKKIDKKTFKKNFKNFSIVGNLNEINYLIDHVNNKLNLSVKNGKINVAPTDIPPDIPLYFTR